MRCDRCNTAYHQTCWRQATGCIVEDCYETRATPESYTTAPGRGRTPKKDNLDFGEFPDPHDLFPDEYGLVALGGRLTPETVCEAYNKGIFPWSGEDPIPWFSPDPRLILNPHEFHRSKSLRKLLRKGSFQILFDKNFDAVLRACALTYRKDQDGTWINGRIPKVYGELFNRGYAHSVEVYHGGRLVGGLYGLSFGRAYGES